MSGVFDEINEDLNEEDMKGMTKKALETAEENDMSLDEFMVYISDYSQALHFLKNADMEKVKVISEHTTEAGVDLGLNLRDDTLSREAKNKITEEILRSMDRIRAIAEEDKRREGE